MRPIQVMVFLAAAAMLAGCSEVSTQYPIGSSSGLAPDPALVGTWLPRTDDGKDIERTADGKIAGYIHVLPIKEGPLTIVMVSLPKKPEDKGDYQIMRATTGQTGKNRFLNAVLLSPAGETSKTMPEQGTVPVLYRFDTNGDLALFKLDEDKAAAAIRAGTIAGTIKKNTYTVGGTEYEGTPDIRITADPAALDAFFAKPDAEALFEPLGRLKKAD